MNNPNTILDPRSLTKDELDNLDEEIIALEWKKCQSSCLYFILNYVFIYDNIESNWIPFILWKAQEETLQLIEESKWLVILKARQLGLTWLCLSYALWLIIFRPIAIIMLFSRRDSESKYLLSDERLKGMYKRLPTWMQSERLLTDSSHQMKLSNDSVVYAFPTTAGDSYTASLVIVDEADLVPDLNTLMKSVKPTIDAGNKIILLSRSDKENPKSPFKNIYRGAKNKKNKWTSIFLPWYCRPDRTDEWYHEQEIDIISRTGYLDTLWEQYPSTDLEALAGATANKRIPPKWLELCYEELDPILFEYTTDAPGIDELKIFKLPEGGLSYTIGADPAEGNPNSNESCAQIICRETGEQVAVMAGLWETDQFAGNIDLVAQFYNKATILIERNNHGHSVIKWFEEHGISYLLDGPDDKVGWLSNRPGKVSLYDDVATGAKNREFLIHDPETYEQLKSIEGATLKAPQHEPDDRADGFSLAFKGVLTSADAVGMRQARVIWNQRDHARLNRDSNARRIESPHMLTKRHNQQRRNYKRW